MDQPRRAEAGTGSHPGIDLRESWNENTPYYHERFKWSYDDVVYSASGATEAKLGLLGDLSGKRILEIGCGGGQASIVFARQGATATGIDLSDAQIERARRKAAEFGVQVVFLRGDVEDLGRIGSGSQDVVFSSNVLDYVGDIGHCFAECHRVLVPGGVLAFSVMHPAYRFCRGLLPADGDGPLKRPHESDLVSYFQRGRYEFEWVWADGGKRIPMYIFRRTVADFLNALVGAGFVVDRMVEPEPDEDSLNGSWVQFHPRSHTGLFPETIVFRAVRPAS